MDTKKIELVNIALIPICLVLSYYLPFRVLIYSYAILGPVHYLTEINWLNENKYFTKSKKSSLWILGIITLFISIPHFFFIPGIAEWTRSNLAVKDFVISWSTWGDPLIFSCLFTAFALVFSNKKYMYYLMAVAGLLIGLALKRFNGFHLLIGSVLPTVIHVYIFTGAFMLYGLIKSKGKLGILTVMLHFLVPVFVIFYAIDPTTYNIPLETKNIFAGVFQTTNLDFEEIIGIDPVTKTTAFKTQIFISYAYLYHYLNWFSKTSIIGWGKVISKKQLIGIGSFSAIAIGAYFYNYTFGLKLLFFLSMLHVMLEFPLNIVSFKGIFQAIPIFNKKS